MSIKGTVNTIAMLVVFFSVKTQTITTTPGFPTVGDEITVTLNTENSSSLANYAGNIYAHAGLITTSSISSDDWKYVIAQWSENLDKAKLSKVSDNIWEFTISPDVMGFYGVSAGDEIEQLAFVFRNENGSKQTANIYVDLYAAGLNIVSDPDKNIIVQTNQQVNIGVGIVTIGSLGPDSTIIYIDGERVISATDDTLSYVFTPTGYGNYSVFIETRNSLYYDTSSFDIIVYDQVIVEDLPSGVRDGINYINDSTATLVFYAPGKENVFVIGDFNNWQPGNDYLMKQTTGGDHHWLTITGLEAGKEYAYQYLVEANLRIPDPYTEKTLDPDFDTYISPTVYPGLKPYPTGKTEEIVSVLQTAQDAFDWEVVDFQGVDAEKLVIYELLIRDFVSDWHIKTVMDSLDYLQNLGVNAIELMPFSEFRGNESWGYDPMFYFAVDKAYGTRNDFKKFIDECHKRGIAVIMDIVLNHSNPKSPLVRLYADDFGSPALDNPWFNPSCPDGAYCWGADFNHESEATKYFVDRVTSFWLTEYNLDGFRFDFTKGFTNTPGEGSAYDEQRIAILKRMYDEIQKVKPEAYLILEHWATNSEEKELSNYGFLLWGQMVAKYNEATMGFNESGKSDLSAASYQNRGWDFPHLVTFMESHDEERLQYKNKTWGNSVAGYDVTNYKIGLARNEAAAVFSFSIPGPKMIWMFGELGYDYSINTCSDGVTIEEGCRTSPKPIRWDYFEDTHRKRLYQVYAAIIDLKTNMGVFNTSDVDMKVALALKTIHLNSVDTNVVVLGNFDLVDQEINPEFQHTGTWYEYFTGKPVEVTDTEALIKLGPGEYRLYTDVKLETPEIIVGINPNMKNVFGDIMAYPNPSEQGFTILVPGEHDESLTITIFNSKGQKIATIPVHTVENSYVKAFWDPSGDSNGFYFARITDGDKTETIKLLKY